MTNLTPAQRAVIQKIMAEIDGWKLLDDGYVIHEPSGEYTDQDTHIPPYTTDLNEIFRVVREWRLKKLDDPEVTTDIIIGGQVSTYNNNKDCFYYSIMFVCNRELICISEDYDPPALALCCALVKAVSRWQEVEDARTN